MQFCDTAECNSALRSNRYSLQPVSLKRLSMLQFKAIRAVCIAGSFESCVLRIRIERARNDFAVLLFRSDEAIGHFGLFDPIDDHGKPINVRGTWTAAAVEAAGNQEQPAI